MQTHVQNLDAYLAPRRKDYYSRLYDYATDRSILNIWDIGCASGDFAFYGPDNINFYCTDVSEPLIELARKTRQKDNITYSRHDILEDPLPSINFDAISILGILTAFDDPYRLFAKIANIGPRCIIGHLTLNPFGYDVLVSHKYFSEPDSSYQNSYNIFATATIQNAINACGYRITVFEPYKMTTNLPKPDSPTRIQSYHASLNDDKVLTNQLGIILHDYILIAEKDD